MVVWFAFPALVWGQLRVVTYNTAGGPRADTGTVLQGIGNEARQGFSKPIDVLALQEQTSSASTTQAIVDVLNGIYGPGTYARATLDVQTSGGGRPGLIYNTQSVQLMSQSAVGSVSIAANARQTARYQLRPTGYSSTSDFYLYVSHYKAGQNFDDGVRRGVEAASNRANADALPTGTHVIYGGDFNIYNSTETMWSTLTNPGAGPGQGFDPVNRVGGWHDNSSFRDVHTQSPTTTTRYSGQITGGIDDRFDWQMVNSELLDQEGLAIINGSYHAFGNNGTHTLNGALDTASNTALPLSLLTAIANASDHLPVVADYQLPARMLVQQTAVPNQVLVGTPVSLLVTVQNSAPVVHALGADELDYAGTVTGDLTGSIGGLAMPLATGNIHAVNLQTGSAGARSGQIEVQATSEGAATADFADTVTYSVWDHAKPSWNAVADVTGLSVDFGFAEYVSSEPTVSAAIHNRIATAGYTAALDIDAVQFTNGAGFLTNATTLSNLLAGSSASFDLTMRTDLYGRLSSQLILTVSDQNLPGETQNLPMTLDLSGLVALSGDATLDGVVGGSDFAALQVHYGTQNAIWEDGDFNSDGQVNGADFAILQLGYGATIHGSVGQSVPEPHAGLLATGVFASLLFIAHRNRRSG